MSTDRFEHLSRSRSRSPEEAPQFPLKISIAQDLLPNFNDPEVMSKIRNGSGARQITINQSLDPPNYIDGVITVLSPSLSQKLSASSMILDEMAEAKPGEKLTFDIFVPENKLSNLTAIYGQNLSSIQKYASINIQRRLNGLKERPIKVNGKLADCKESVQLIFKGMFEKKNSPPRKYDLPIIKFIAPGEIASELERTNTSLSRLMKSEFGLDVAVKSARAPFRESESIVTISGRQDNCIDALKELISRLHEYSETFKLIVEADSALSSSSKNYSGLLRDVKEKIADIDIWSERFQDGRTIFISGPRRSKHEALKALLTKGERRRSVDRRSPRRDSPRRENSPRRAKQSSINITVPETLVARLIGKNGENIKNIMHKSNSNISFQKQEQPDIKTPDGGPARICTLKGTPNSIADGLKILLDQVISLGKH